MSGDSGDTGDKLIRRVCMRMYARACVHAFDSAQSSNQFGLMLCVLCSALCGVQCVRIVGIACAVCVSVTRVLVRAVR